MNDTRSKHYLIEKQTIRKTYFNMKPFRIIKQEIIGDQVFNEIIKQENIYETHHNDDSQLLPTGCSVQVLNGIIKKEIIGDQVFNEIIKQEITDEKDHNNDRQLLQIGSFDGKCYVENELHVSTNNASEQSDSDLELEQKDNFTVNVIPTLQGPRGLSTILWAMYGLEERLKKYDAQRLPILKWKECIIKENEIDNLFQKTTQAILQKPLAHMCRYKQVYPNVYTVTKIDKLVSIPTAFKKSGNISDFWKNNTNSTNDISTTIDFQNPNILFDKYCEAADMLVSNTFSGSDGLYFDNISPCELLSEMNNVTHNGYVDELCSKYKSKISSVVQKSIGICSGINRSTFYVGNVQTASVMHIEGDHLPSINILYKGMPKLWLSLSKQSQNKHVQIMKRYDSGYDVQDLTYFFHPTFFKTHNIPIDITFQTKRSGLYIKTNILHQIINLGPNFSESVNFGSQTWYLSKKNLTGFKILHPSVKDINGAYYRLRQCLKPPETLTYNKSYHVPATCFLCKKYLKRLTVHLKGFHKLDIIPSILKNPISLEKYKNLTLKPVKNKLDEKNIIDEFYKIIADHALDQTRNINVMQRLNAPDIVVPISHPNDDTIRRVSDSVPDKAGNVQSTSRTPTTSLVKPTDIHKLVVLSKKCKKCKKYIAVSKFPKHKVNCKFLICNYCRKEFSYRTSLLYHFRKSPCRFEINKFT